MIEVEVRSFLTEEQYEELLERLREESEEWREDEQVTYYFEGEDDLRIQKNNNGAKIWMKKGEIHDDAREELEIVADREDFGKMEELFRELGYDVQIKWFRTRNRFRWDGIKTTVDFTEGYGHVLELEELVESEEEIEEAKERLKKKMGELGIEPTPKEKFQERYEYYRDNWRELVGG